MECPVLTGHLSNGFSEPCTELVEWHRALTSCPESISNSSGTMPDKTSSQSDGQPFGDAVRSGTFPETQTAILEEAAAGNWDRFLSAYLEPCWREIVIACRSRRIPLEDADDLYQELVLRMIRDGDLRLPAESGQDGPAFKANVPARFLKYRELTLRSARFRTVLKSVVRHLILEYFRSRKRLPRQLGENAEPGSETAIEESVSGTIDRQWLAECLLESAAQLQDESAQARTRGKRRLFDVLVRTTVHKESAAEIADRWQLDRTTVAELVTRSRGRFVELLRKSTEIEEVAELKQMVVRSAQLVVEALTVINGRMEKE